jgi:hypothetical protein
MACKSKILKYTALTGRAPFVFSATGKTCVWNFSENDRCSRPLKIIFKPAELILEPAVLKFLQPA